MNKYIIIPKRLLPTALQYIENNSDITWNDHCKPTQYYGGIHCEPYDSIMLVRRICNNMRMTWDFPDSEHQLCGFNHLNEFIK